ncbi:MAG: hypothetical protein OEW11_02645 [Nitrospirota bacterium]|nr:hypothetical protein [Nitrospirota bacterium]
MSIYTDIEDACDAYLERFGSGAPTLGLSDDEAIRAIEEALLTGQPMTRPDMDNLPPGAYF